MYFLFLLLEKRNNIRITHLPQPSVKPTTVIQTLHLPVLIISHDLPHRYRKVQIQNPQHLKQPLEWYPLQLNQQHHPRSNTNLQKILLKIQFEPLPIFINHILVLRVWDVILNFVFISQNRQQFRRHKHLMKQSRLLIITSTCRNEVIITVNDLRSS